MSLADFMIMLESALWETSYIGDGYDNLGSESVQLPRR
jgi:hypothetical protein